jgi:hypothetical protein
MDRAGNLWHNLRRPRIGFGSQACARKRRLDVLWFIKTKRRRVSMQEGLSWIAALCMVFDRYERPGNERGSLTAKIQACFYLRS